MEAASYAEQTRAALKVPLLGTEAPAACDGHENDPVDAQQVRQRDDDDDDTDQEVANVDVTIEDARQCCTDTLIFCFILAYLLLCQFSVACSLSSNMTASPYHHHHHRLWSIVNFGVSLLCVMTAWFFGKACRVDDYSELDTLLLLLAPEIYLNFIITLVELTRGDSIVDQQFGFLTLQLPSLLVLISFLVKTARYLYDCRRRGSSHDDEDTEQDDKAQDEKLIIV
jgi:hypothetical protein